MEPYEIYDYKGFKINVFMDENYDDQDLKDDQAFIVYDHNQFYVRVKGFDPEEIFNYINEKNGSKYLPLYKHLNFINGKYETNYYHVFPLYAYIHSGVALSLGNNSYPFTCPWDTSMSGFVLIKQVKGWTYRREKALKVAESVVENWNDGLSGNVWGYTITYNPLEIINDEDNKPEFDEEIESCWDFYGDNWKEDSEMVKECKSIIDHTIEKNPEKYAIKQLQLDL